MANPIKHEELTLFWHNYKYFPYEKELALLEVNSLFNTTHITQDDDSLRINGVIKDKYVERLSYFAKGVINKRSVSTKQFLLEEASNAYNGNGKNRQSTRYSSHGLHEYKGKFNPQVVRGVINMFSLKEGSRILDPFCGSGTTLVECFHMGMNATGIDINPLAVYVSNAKILALSINPADLGRIGKSILSFLKKRKGSHGVKLESEREHYLSKWFSKEVLCDIERLRQCVLKEAEEFSPIFLSIASNLLRDYSLQEPSDLRIRRRRSPMPLQPFIEAYIHSFNSFLYNVKSASSILGYKRNKSIAYVDDIRHISSENQKKLKSHFHCALTSPPYATALPYIDTQRLSLVWLDLCKPSMILNLDSELVGSRELKGKSKSDLVSRMIENRDFIPPDIHDFCLKLNKTMATTDGFRRRATPLLLYRYFSDMKEGFISVKSLLLKDAPYALIVGHNHTTIGGRRFDINTPDFLQLIAKQVGWIHDRTINLQTYQRYGLHMKNAVAKESLIILRKP